MCNGTTKPINILLVEDDQIDAKAFMRAIRQQRISNPVTVAKDGVEGWEILKGESGISLNSGQVLLLDRPRIRIGEAVHALHPPPILEKSFDQVGTDKTCRSSHQCCACHTLFSHRCRGSPWQIPSLSMLAAPGHYVRKGISAQVSVCMAS